MEEKLDRKASLSFACSLFLFPSFGLHSSPFISKREETRWQGFAFLLEEDNGEKSQK
jgi:hypothetical protein